MPAWLDALIVRAVAVDPAQRFGDVVELIQRLEAGSARAAPRRARAPLIERNPVAVWQGVSLILLIALLVSLASR